MKKYCGKGKTTVRFLSAGLAVLILVFSAAAGEPGPAEGIIGPAEEIIRESEGTGAKEPAPEDPGETAQDGMEIPLIEGDGKETVNAPDAIVLSDETESETVSRTVSETESETPSSETEGSTETAPEGTPEEKTEGAAGGTAAAPEEIPDETEQESTEVLYTDETESELQSPAAEDEEPETVSLSVKVTPRVEPSAASPYKSFFVTVEQDYGPDDVVPDGAEPSEQEGPNYSQPLKLEGFARGADYRLTFFMAHYKEASCKVSVDDEGAFTVSEIQGGTVTLSPGDETELSVTLEMAVYLSKSQLTQISLTNLKKISRSYALEGGTATGSFLISAFMKNDLESQLKLFSLSDYSVITTKTVQYTLQHANDMTYVAPANLIYVTPMGAPNRVVMLDASTLAYKGEFALEQNYHAIAYDAATGRFFCVYEGPKGIICDVRNTTLKTVINSFPILTNLTYQGAAAYNSLLYYTCWEKGATGQYQPVYDKVLKANDNVIYVYSMDGNLVKTYYIQGGSGKFELETIMFVDGRMILQTNEGSGSSKKAGYYRVDPTASSVTLAVPVTQNGSAAPDKAYTAAVTLNGKQLAAQSSLGGVFTARDLPVKEPGDYTYIFKEKKGKDTLGYVYDTEPVMFRVIATYDPLTNGLTVKKSGPSRAVITNTKLTKAQKKNRKAFQKKVPSVRKVKGKKKKVSLSWEKVKFGKKSAQGYEVQVCRKKSFSGSTLQTFVVKGTKKTVKNLLSKKRYYVRIRALYSIGAGTFRTKYSAAKKVKTK